MPIDLPFDPIEGECTDPCYVGMIVALVQLF